MVAGEVLSTKTGLLDRWWGDVEAVSGGFGQEMQRNPAGELERRTEIQVSW